MFMFFVFLLLISVVKGDNGELETIKTSYVCPQGFHLIGRKCYHFSSKEVSWHDSHFYCITLNSTLAVVDSYRELHLLRVFLNKTVTDLGKYERWIDGIYDYKQIRWKWGSSGHLITYNKFARLQIGDKFHWHCIVLNPSKQNNWSARKCTDKRRYVCQTETNSYIEFRLFNKKPRKKFNIAKCSNLEWLPKNEKRKCLKLLDSTYSEPEYIVKKPKRAKPTKATTLDPDDFVCPPHMIGLGNTCYSFSKEPAFFMDAYFDCRKNKSRLALIRNRRQDVSLRILLNGNFIEKHDRWIGGIYDWKSNQWKWAMTGKALKYKGFGKDVLKNHSNDSLAWNAIYMDPSLKNSWNIDKETVKKHYICQVKARAVKKLDSKLKSSQATITIVNQQG